MQAVREYAVNVITKEKGRTAEIAPRYVVMICRLVDRIVLPVLLYLVYLSSLLY